RRCSPPSAPAGAATALSSIRAIATSSSAAQPRPPGSEEIHAATGRPFADIKQERTAAPAEQPVEPAPAGDTEAASGARRRSRPATTRSATVPPLLCQPDQTRARILQIFALPDGKAPRPLARKAPRAR